jgi:hypothetical protein
MNKTLIFGGNKSHPNKCNNVSNSVWPTLNWRDISTVLYVRGAETTWDYLDREDDSDGFSHKE